MFDWLFLLITLLTGIKDWRQAKWLCSNYPIFRGWAFKRWNELIADEIDNIVQQKDLSVFFEVAGSEMIPPKGKIFDKISNVIPGFFQMISSSEEAKSLYEKYFVVGTRNPFAKMFWARWDELSRAEIKNAKNLVEIRKAVFSARCIYMSSHGDPVEEGIMKWIELCQTPNEMEEARCFAIKANFYYSIVPLEEKAKLMAGQDITRWDRDEIITLSRFVHSSTEAHLKFFKRIVELSPTLESMEGSPLSVVPEENRFAYDLIIYEKFKKVPKSH